MISAMKVLSWNVYHGRSPALAGRDLLPEFSAALAGWEWDVALLQECPPWWPAALAAAAGAQQRTRLTARNSFGPVRRALAVRWPDVMRSWGGGCNAILVRGAVIAEHREHRLAWLPESRWMHGVRLADGGWVVNVHATTGNDAQAETECVEAAQVAVRWAAGAPLVFGGDLNLRHPPVMPGLQRVAGNYVDHIFADRATKGRQRVLERERGPLSDHAPVLVAV